MSSDASDYILWLALWKVECQSQHFTEGNLQAPTATVCGAAPGPAGFNAAKDTQDSYQFIYPFGWQEVSVDGQDVVYKDIIEPLESASVSITKTDKTSVTEFGNPLEVQTASLRVPLLDVHLLFCI